MFDSNNPTASTDFIVECIENSGKLAKGGIIKIGNTITFVIDGPQAIFKRSCSLRELSKGEVKFEQATALAIRFGFMEKLLRWFDVHMKWKDGAYRL
ncbi:hypothetical protein GA0116948_10979 [Chitinophaga costaii]|uniref:Uncharacterized protein n=1 Tax=Chitinophaga costaii TaxID=1335309 RepID=A0A1C4EP52_9BACT|nr:hypothetical protein [Chitinophaga costaii]PUZ22482.1 hypothetical protein DCM91_14535 [Chitinophaga costaii]SCC45331.1 hypothetical protein GA0116948_10979 [Chitinophaga costaii]